MNKIKSLYRKLIKKCCSPIYSSRACIRIFW